MAKAAHKTEWPLWVAGAAGVGALFLFSSSGSSRKGAPSNSPTIFGGEQGTPSREYTNENTGAATAAGLASDLLNFQLGKVQTRDQLLESEDAVRGQEYEARVSANAENYQSYLGSQDTQFLSVQQSEEEQAQLAAEEEMMQSEEQAMQPPWWESLLGGLSSVGSMFAGIPGLGSIFGGGAMPGFQNTATYSPYPYGSSGPIF